MPEPNELLRAARERVESPSSPGQAISRQELADLVNRQVYRASETITSIDANHVGKWERGVIRWPAARYRAALRVIFDAATDTDLGFAPPKRSGNPSDVDRKTFLKTTLGAGAWALMGGRTAVASERSHELAATVAGPTEHFRRMESAVSSQQLAPAVEAHLKLAEGVVHDTIRTTAGFGVLSEIAGLAAWLAADRGDFHMARRRYNDSIRHAEAAGHPLLVAYMTASLGHYAVESGDAHQGLRLLHRAHRWLDNSAPPAARAWLSSLYAVTHAALGNTAATTTALRTAERLAARPGEPQWPWVFPFTPAKVARYQSSALARLGDVRAARTAYSSAAPALTSPKPRALAQIEHAQVLARAGHVGEACHLAAEAATLGQRYGSERITERARRFRAHLPARTTEAVELDDALTALYEQESAW